MNIRLFIIIFISAIPFLISSQSVQFYREDLDFRIDSDYFIVDGLYYFRNPAEKAVNLTLFYPFPQDSLYGEVDSVLVVNLGSDSQRMFFDEEEKGIKFQLDIAGNSTAIYRIGYRQKLLSSQAEYILTTTQKWGKSFEEVNYSLFFPKVLQLDSISIMPDSLREADNHYLLLWHKENFMPDCNLIIRFLR